MSAPGCRLCGAPLTHTFVDLGMSPPCESYLTRDELDQGETFYPLHVRVCADCLLVQLPAYISPEEIFSHYAYFSSYSESWVTHAGQFVGAAVDRLGLDSDSFIVEVASNDGYLLQYFARAGIPVLGIEPTVNTATAATAKGIPTLNEFFAKVPILRDDYARVEQAVRDHLAGATPRLDIEYRIVRHGEVRWVMNRAKCFRDGSGRAADGDSPTPRIEASVGPIRVIFTMPRLPRVRTADPLKMSDACMAGRSGSKPCPPLLVDGFSSMSWPLPV